MSADTSAIDLPVEAWPAVDLDPVARMRALAAGLPHVASDETVFDVSYDTLWSFIADLETNTPRFEGTVRQLRIIDRVGDTLAVDARTPIGLWLRFDVILRPGWCLMRSSHGDVGMAARPEDPHGTRFFHFEGSRGLGRLLRPCFAWNIRQDFRKLRSLLA